MNRQWVMAARPQGAVRESDFRMVESPVPELVEDGQYLVRTMYLSLAPVMRMYMLDGAGIEKPMEIGEVMRGRGVGRVVASRNPAFAVGDVVQAKLGWQDYARLDASPYWMAYRVAQRLVPFSTALGVLGVTGFTAYLGLTEIGRVQAGDTVLVSGAAGGVGSNCGFVARNLGARVVGIAGTDEKCALLASKLGYDAAINYRTDDVPAKLAEHCPQGVDVFFDNVGGAILDHALARINRYARVVICGRISEYLKSPDDAYRMRNWDMIGKRRARMEGFFIYDLEAHFARAEAQMAEWIAAGRMTYQEDVLEGLEQMPRALIRLYEGLNVGKQVVRVERGAR
ncbi:MAG: NADP-dependent oxidoreductase [Steroidobacteraceae bacterium]|nr:NADP-dependent oxidoreductase [Steroidobacteraceae bacterium]